MSASLSYQHDLTSNHNESFFVLDYLYKTHKNMSFFDLAFQKKVDLYTQSCVGYEALVRCTPQGVSVLSPDVCIHWLTTRGYMAIFQDWLLRQSGQAFPYMPTHAHLSVNICASTLTLSYAYHIVQLCQAIHLPMNRLCIEITESHKPESFVEIGKAVYFLRHHGIKVALDDFGTGYSTIKYLLYTDLDEIKIDRSYVQGVSKNCTTQETLRHMMSIVSEHTSAITLEGIECKEDMQTLQSMFACCGINVHGQGYLFGRPTCLGYIL